jgi:type IV pilus assembly protein PilW
MSNPDLRRASRCSECGLSLVELLVGLSIGLLVILAAISALSLSRGVSGSVSDLSQLQQQGSYALHVIGSQFRQTASSDPVFDPDNKVYAFAGDSAKVGTTSAAVWGRDGTGTAADSVSVAFFPSPLSESPPKLWQRDCNGESLDQGVKLLQTTLSVDNGQLMCTGLRKLAVIRNVSDFRVNYRVRTDDGMRVMNATAVDKAKLWNAVSAIEVCLDLIGDEKAPDAGTAYTDCQGQTRSRNGRIHLVFHNTFELRVK